MYLPREIESELNKFMKRREAIIIKGPRQAGKTTLLKHLKDIYGGNYINLEIPVNREIMEKNPLKFSENKGPLYFDEIGEVENAGKSLKLIYDESKAKLVVSGSGAFEVKQNIGGELVGRAIYFELLSLSFKEFIRWNFGFIYDLYSSTNKEVIDFIKKGKVPIEPAKIKEIETAFEEYSKWGSYPAVVLEKEDKERIIAGIVETAIERDVFNFFDIREKKAIRDFLYMLAYRGASMLNINSFPFSYKTVEKYLNILHLEYFIDLIYPFHKNLSTELRKTPKVFFLDLGIQEVLSKHRVDKGRAVESFVYSQLRRRFKEINYWRTEGKAEVDFIIREGKELIPIEVKAGEVKKISRSFRSFIKAYSPKRALILTDNYYDVKKEGDTTIVFYPFYWL